MTTARVSLALLVTVVVVVLVIGIVQLTKSSSASGAGSALHITPAQIRARLAGSPEPLAALHAQASELLGEGDRAVSNRLGALRGEPIVINKWASWCGPCHAEIPSFQRASLAFGRTVAFIGIDSLDTDRTEALAFLHSFPVGYPSYYDPSGSIGTDITDSTFVPVTVFYNRRGEDFIHQGPFTSLAKLERDIRLYALGE
jgi:cytochrome c biogenesis protein CcmG/thiol:disulfide interchange protein DsbE